MGMMGRMASVWVACLLSSGCLALRVPIRDNLVADITAFGLDGLHVVVGPHPHPLAVQALLPEPPFASVAVDEGVSATTNGNLRADVGADGLLKFTRVSDGVVLLRETSRSVVGNTSKVSFSSDPTEILLGMGEHRTDKVRVKPFYQNLQDSEDYSHSEGGDSNIPILLSSKGWAFLWNLASFGSCNLTDESLDWVSADSDQIDYWVATTPANSNASSPFPVLMNRFVDATGHAQTLPPWASGFWQCKNRYKTQAEVLQIANEYVSRGVPLSVIVIDWHHWLHEGDWSFNPECWPDPRAMVDELNTLGVHLVVSVWPTVESTSVNYQTMAEKGYLVKGVDGKPNPVDGNRCVYDPFNPDAREYVFEQLVKGYLQYGIETYWLDAAEPEQNHIGCPHSPFRCERRLSSGGEALLRSWRGYHCRDGLREISRPDGLRRGSYLSLPRHSWAGSQRYGAALWSGDISSTFDELHIQVRVAQQVAMSGLPWWTTDIGGYKNGNPDDPVMQELIVRWFQFGAFCPLFRLHGCRTGHKEEDAASTGAPDCGTSCASNEIWVYGDVALQAITRVIEIREQIRPYVMKYLNETAETGMPVVRPMMVEFPDDPLCAADSLEGQFMFGPDWLISPVTTYKARSWPVYLPKLPSGQKWVNFFDGKTYTAGTNVTVSTPVDEFPLFERRTGDVRPV